MSRSSLWFASPAVLMEVKNWSVRRPVITEWGIDVLLHSPCHAIRMPSQAAFSSSHVRHADGSGHDRRQILLRIYRAQPQIRRDFPGKQNNRCGRGKPRRVRYLAIRTPRSRDRTVVSWSRISHPWKEVSFHAPHDHRFRTQCRRVGSEKSIRRQEVKVKPSSESTIPS